jgi:hypothetical protein
LYGFDCMSMIHFEPNLFCIFKSFHAWLFKKLFANRLHSFLQEAMVEETEEEVTGTEA